LADLNEDNGIGNISNSCSLQSSPKFCLGQNDFMNNYLILIVALVSPAIFIIVYRISFVGRTSEAGNIHYLIKSPYRSP
jgi:hypothetical protein